MDIKTGDIIFGNTEEERYEIITPIGSGSFGIVYEAQDKNGRKYAVKTVKTTFLDKDSLRSLNNEGNLAIDIRHECVLLVHYFHDGTKYSNFPPYMILEYAEGGTLEDRINEKRLLQEFFSEEEIYELFIHLSQGMKAINEHLVHRDVKPDNILFVSGVPKIADFGLSKIVGTATRSSTFKGINHIKYCAPEAWRIEANTPAMDMYSLGIVFYEIATLSYPYQVPTTGDLVESWKKAHLVTVPEDPRNINPDLDNNISQVIMKMIEKQPQRRYSSWDELLNRLSNTEINQEQRFADGVPALVQRSMERRREEEMVRLRTEEEQRMIDEYEEVISFCFNYIVSTAEEFVGQFNQASDFAQLQLRKNSRYSFDIRHKKRTDRGRVVVTISPLFQEHILDGNKIKAWGFAKSPSGKGFNLLLISTKPDDLYGDWFTLHVSHSALARSTDSRQAPFPFELNELPRGIQLLGSMHIFDTEQSKFEPDFFVPLLEELV
jgi:serine/threonine protein kinase